MTAGSPRSPQSPDAGYSFSNQAKDGANVGIQAGVIHGDANIYTGGESAEDQYHVGLNLLRGNMQRQAEQHISNAFN